ncbi:SRPBCC family protein [Deinococcus sonorensis]|uniref:SRPBCC family protein n=2 Tax=Deinococcus sonorensis TaxID=309891 RepID=A0AAU7U4K6_9DEIO
MEYSGFRHVQASPEQVYAFVSDVRNLPRYLPTTKHAEPQGPDRVVVDGVAQGHDYHADGQFHQDAEQRRLSWSSDGEIRYSGHLEVVPAGTGESEVRVHLTFDPDPQHAATQGTPGHAPQDHQIQEGIDKALESIANQLEGRGGKVEPSSAGTT